MQPWPAGVTEPQHSCAPRYQVHIRASHRTIYLGRCLSEGKGIVHLLAKQLRATGRDLLLTGDHGLYRPLERLIGQ